MVNSFVKKYLNRFFNVLNDGSGTPINRVNFPKTHPSPFIPAAIYICKNRKSGEDVFVSVKALRVINSYDNSIYLTAKKI
jgi:hypothetical protein